MIDYESEIFSKVSTELRKLYPNIYVTGEYVRTPSSFPAVSIVEIDNAAYRSTLTQQSHENHAALTYEVNVYSNLASGKKSECKKIMGLVDSVLTDLNFTRTLLQPVPNLNNASIYRMIGRYRGVADRSGILYRR